MPSAASALLGLEEMAAGEKSNAWGPITNTNLNLLEQAGHGVVGFTLSGSKTLTNDNYIENEARKMVLNITGGSGGTITIPNRQHVYVVRNGASGSVTITTGSGTTAVIPALTRTVCFCDGSNAVYAVDMTDLWVYGRTASNVTNASTSETDVTGAQIDVSGLTNDAEYEFEGRYYIKSTGSAIARFVWPASLTDGVCEMRLANGTAEVMNSGTISPTSFETAATAIGTAYRLLTVRGHLIKASGSSGSVKIQIRANSGTPTTTVREGSFLRYRRTYP